MKGGVFLKRTDIEGLDWISIDPTLKTYSTFCSEFSFNDKNYMDFDWIEEQLKYVNTLSEGKRKILYSYTKYGDVLINNLLRDTLTDELLGNMIDAIQQNIQHPLLVDNILNFDTKQSIIESIKRYALELKQIIIDAPKLKIPIKVFRGIKEDKHITNLNKRNNNGFLSTTLYLPSTEMFMGEECCLLEITISPEVPCLFIAPISKEPGEFEILIDNSFKLTVINRTVKKYMDIPNITTMNNALNITSKYSLDEKNVIECIITS